MRIVQLSDIHLSKTSLTNFKNYYRKALIQDLLEYHQKQAIDVILITGDLVDQGGSSLGKNPYRIFEEEFINPLISALKLKAHQILMIPGNHDIDRDGIEEENEFYLIGKLDKEMANIMLNKTKDKFTKENKRIKKFKTFEKAFHLGSPSYSYSNNESMAIIESKGHKFGIALINDSWRCSKELKPDNHFIGANQLFNAKEYFGSEKTQFNIAVFHHPIDVLNINERESIENILKSTNFEMAVFGHKHNYKFEQILSPNGGYLTLQGRTAFSKTEEKESRYQSGYSLVDINLEEKSYTLHARKFIFEGFHFDMDVDSVRGGTLSGQIPQKQNYVALAASENNADKELPDSYTAEVNRIVTLLVGKSLYEDPYIFVRELIQNSVDACNREKSKNTHKLPLIKFRINSKEQYIEVEDEGDGMTKAVVKNHFAVIGQSISHEFNDNNGKFNLISQFGIGFISTFIVAQKVVVTTRHEDDQQISFQINNVFKGFSYKEIIQGQQLIETGTKVRVYFKKGYDPVAAFDQVRRYCRHIENLKAYFNDQEMQLVEDWNVNLAKCIQIIPTDKYELRIGISAHTRQIIASNSGFMINEMPMQLIPYKFP